MHHNSPVDGAIYQVENTDMKQELEQKPNDPINPAGKSIFNHLMLVAGLSWFKLVSQLVQLQLVAPACPSLSKWTLLKLLYTCMEAGNLWFIAS